MYSQDLFDAHKKALDAERVTLLAEATLGYLPLLSVGRIRELLYLMVQNEAGIDPKAAEAAYTASYWNGKTNELKAATKHCFYEV